MNQEEIRFMGWPRTIVPVPSDIAQITADICPGPDRVWILSPTFRNRLPEIVALWPGGTVKDYLYSDGEGIFTAYRVSDK